MQLCCKKAYQCDSTFLGKGLMNKRKVVRCESGKVLFEIQTYEELNLLCVFAPCLEFWHDEKSFLVGGEMLSEWNCNGAASMSIVQAKALLWYRKRKEIICEPKCE
ncbi:unnamed protein product [Albugo candida]|uniref:Uncharacterized protein n=1 Tax=Albugo candida TaxID=65357 RepID=A0A024GRD3_9STRA|nr:unnamed protein product [Albugo candida]|eukprot:CCI49294.1 unnamed protein product [Albugo candida]